MATRKQILGKKGVDLVTKHSACPNCKRGHVLRALPPNFKCADIICDFCGYLAQVKTKETANIERPPKLLPGAAWGVQKERMDAGIYFPLFLVLRKRSGRFSIFYLSADNQTPELFLKRAPLKPTARRAGWQGFMYDLSKVIGRGLIRTK